MHPRPLQFYNPKLHELFANGTGQLPLIPSCLSQTSEAQPARSSFSRNHTGFLLLSLPRYYFLFSSSKLTQNNLPSLQKGTFQSMGTHAFSGFFFSPSDDRSYWLGLRMPSRPCLCSVSGYTLSWTHSPGTGPPHPAVSKATFPTIWLKWDSQRRLSSSQLCLPLGQFIHSAHWNVKAQMGNEPIT